MGERKVLNKYYPPDFDPAKIPRRRRPKNEQMKVRMMLPMSIQCATCGTYIYKGTKFNSRKEDVIGETYLGIQIFRFYFKCTKCSAEITIKTDPRNSDYTVESGASRNFEPWRDEEEAAEKEKMKRGAEEMGDAMKSLENRAMDSKQDMDILAALEEMKSMKSRHATVSIDLMLETLQRTAQEKEKKIMEEDEALIKSIVFHGSKDYVRRIDDEDEDDDDDDIGEAAASKPSANGSEPSSQGSKGKGAEPSGTIGRPTDSLIKASILDKSKNKETLSSSLALKPKFIVKPRAKGDDPVPKQPTGAPSASDKPKEEAENEVGIGSNGTSTALQSLCQNYESDQSE